MPDARQPPVRGQLQVQGLPPALTGNLTPFTQETFNVSADRFAGIVLNAIVCRNPAAGSRGRSHAQLPGCVHLSTALRDAVISLCFLFARMFTITTMITTRIKISADSAHSAVFMSVWEPFVAFTT